jgi:intracellular septation protein
MKFFFDLIPALIFLAFYLLVDIYAATKALMIFATLQVIWEYFKHGKVSKMALITFALVIPFGAITLFLHDDFFIKLKFSIFYWVLAIALLVSNYFYKKNLIHLMMHKQIEAADAVWAKMNLAWAGFFVLIGLVNLLFIFKFPQYWIYYKFPGVPIAMMVFMLGLFGLLNKQLKFIEPDAVETDSEKPKE